MHYSNNLKVHFVSNFNTLIKSINIGYFLLNRYVWKQLERAVKYSEIGICIVFYLKDIKL